MCVCVCVCVCATENSIRTFGTATGQWKTKVDQKHARFGRPKLGVDGWLDWRRGFESKRDVVSFYLVAEWLANYSAPPAAPASMKLTESASAQTDWHLLPYALHEESETVYDRCGITPHRCRPNQPTAPAHPHPPAHLAV